MTIGAGVEALAVLAPVALERRPQGPFLRSCPARKSVLSQSLLCLRPVQLCLQQVHSTRSLCHGACPLDRSSDSMSVRSSPKNDSFCNTFFFLIENVRHWIECIRISVSQCPSKNKPLTIICSNDENGLKLKNLL